MSKTGKGTTAQAADGKEPTISEQDIAENQATAAVIAKATAEADPKAEADADADAKVIDVDRIKALITDIETKGGQRIMDLVQRLMTEEGMTLEENKLTLAGVTCRANDNPSQTMGNWCNAARRALLRAA